MIAVAGHPLERRGGEEDDVVVWEVGGIVVVNIVRHAGRQLPRRKLSGVGGGREPQLVDLPVSVGVRHGEHELVGVPVEFEVVDQAGAGRFVEGRELAFGADRGKQGDFVGPMIHIGHGAVVPGALARNPQVFAIAEAFPAGASRAANRDAFDDQQLVKVQERVG